MKEEIETAHFEHTFAVLGTNRAAEPLLTKQVEVCVFHYNLSHGFHRVMSDKFLFSTRNPAQLLLCDSEYDKVTKHERKIDEQPMFKTLSTLIRLSTERLRVILLTFSFLLFYNPPL